MENISGDRFVIKLKEKLKENLPGMEAHLQMAPPQRLDEIKKYEPNESTKRGGVLILLYPDNNVLHFPLIQRPEDTGVHSGQIALPGGKQDPEDRDMIDTALRETLEEIGVKVEREQVIGQLSTLYIPPSNFLVYPTVALIDHLPEFEPSPQEVSKLLKINLPEFVRNERREIREIKARYMKAKVPSFELDNHIVWGATAMILNELLSIIRSLKSFRYISEDFKK